MTDLNHVVLIGRLTHDVELKYLPNGSPVANLSIAVNRNKKEGDQWIEQTSFFNVQLWGNSAENLKQYLVKGKMIAVDGELRQDRWEKDGQTQSKVYIYSRNIQLLGGRDGGSGNGAGGTAREITSLQTAVPISQNKTQVIHSLIMTAVCPTAAIPVLRKISHFKETMKCQMKS